MTEVVVFDFICLPLPGCEIECDVPQRSRVPGTTVVMNSVELTLNAASDTTVPDMAASDAARAARTTQQKIYRQLGLSDRDVQTYGVT